MPNFDWFDLMKAITYAHVSASTSPAPGAEPTTLADEGEAPAKASPSFEVAAEVSAPPGGIRGKEDGACAECIPSSPGIYPYFEDDIERARR